MTNLQRFYLKKDEHTYWTLPVDTQTTAQDICDAIANKLELKNGSCSLLESKLDKNATWGIIKFIKEGEGESGKE
jgi:hypothetical protein